MLIVLIANDREHHFADVHGPIIVSDALIEWNESTSLGYRKSYARKSGRPESSQSGVTERVCLYYEQSRDSPGCA